MLLLDRFLCSDGSTLDLATGEPVRTRVSARPPATPTYATRGRWCLIDHGPRSARTFLEVWSRTSEIPQTAGALFGLRAALQDARDGCPHLIDMAAESGGAWRRTVLDIGREARLAGFVPAAAAVLGELLRNGRGQWPRWLADRSLVVITCDGQLSSSAATALLRLAGRDARPHIVIRGSTRCTTFPARWSIAPAMARDAPDIGEREGVTTTPEALAERAWEAAGGGRAGEDTTAAARWAAMLAPSAAVEITARAALAVALAGQGRVLEARAALPDDTPCCTPEVDQCVATARRRLEEAGQPRRNARALTDDFLQLLEACQAIEDEVETIGQVVGLLRGRVAAAGVSCIAMEHGQVRTIAEVGLTAAREPASAREVIETGVARVPDAAHVPAEGAWPVRYAGATVGALWCRWSIGLPVRPDDADALMRLAAAAIAPAVHGAMERARASADTSAIPEMVGQSEAMCSLRAAVLKAARSPFPVLIEGESGSGKELVARAIHRTSARRDRRFSALNCAALGEDLAEAELFGHAKGAFTGAVGERVGLFEDSSGGTLFLDEVSELSLRVQAKLLRVLQESEVRRVGESHVRPIDTRILAATNRPLADEVSAGRFRRDLCYRIDVVRLSIPPLRQRLEDVPALVRHIWSLLSQKTGSRAVLSPGAMSALGRYDWPGNVRELQNVLASLIVAGPARGSVGASQLPAHVGRSAVLSPERSLASARHEFERRFVKAALARANGRPSVAARDLRVSRQGLAKVLARLGLQAALRDALGPRRRDV